MRSNFPGSWGGVVLMTSLIGSCSLLSSSSPKCEGWDQYTRNYEATLEVIDKAKLTVKGEVKEALIKIEGETAQKRIEQVDACEFFRDGRITFTEYERRMKDIDATYLEIKGKTQELSSCGSSGCVDVLRVANFEAIRCNPDGSRTDTVIFEDTYTVTKASAFYPASAIALSGQEVSVFDLSVDPPRALDPIDQPDPASQKRIYRWNVSLDPASQTARVRWVWQNAHFNSPQPTRDGLEFQPAQHILRNVEARYVPSNVVRNPRVFQPTGAKIKCISVDGDTDRCEDLYLNYAQFLFEWDIWKDCSKGVTDG